MTRANIGGERQRGNQDETLANKDEAETTALPIVGKGVGIPSQVVIRGKIGSKIVNDAAPNLTFGIFVALRRW